MLPRPARWLAAAVALTRCAPAPPAPAARASAPPAASSPPVASAAPPPPASAPAPPAEPPLERSTATLTRLFDKPIRFLITGEKGRLAVLAEEDGAIVPHRFEAGRWERIPLPDAHRVAATDPVGIYFGRDDRPRLMGFRASGKRMVYLRYRDGRWQDQRKEIGALAGDDARLYGVLGEADPEVVCRAEKTCLFKRRTGWQEAKPTLALDAVVRAFAGQGYGLGREGLVRTGPSGFEAFGPKAAWTTAATGLWVSGAGQVAVVEPARGLLHELDAGGAAWRSVASPIASPRDVVGPAERRILVGDGGAARRESGRWLRLGEPGLRLSRAIEVGARVVLGGESGVFEM